MRTNILSWKLVRFVLTVKNTSIYELEGPLCLKLEGDDGSVVTLTIIPEKRYDGQLPPSIRVDYHGEEVFRAAVDGNSVFPPIGDFIYHASVYVPGKWEETILQALRAR